MDWGSPDGPLGPGIGFIAVMLIFLLIKNVVGGRLNRWEQKQDQRRHEESLRRRLDTYATEYHRKKGESSPQDANTPTE